MINCKLTSPLVMQNFWVTRRPAYGPRSSSTHTTA